MFSSVIYWKYVAYSIQTTVLQFKERLRDELNIQIERQRLIFQGKVLQDNTKLADSSMNKKKNEICL